MNEEMNFWGLTDLPERAAPDCDRCRCGSFARVASGLCVSCLLRSGLDSNEAHIEDFDTLLAAVDIPDRDWQLGSYRIWKKVAGDPVGYCRYMSCSRRPDKISQGPGWRRRRKLIEPIIAKLAQPTRKRTSLMTFPPKRCFSFRKISILDTCSSS
jgi:hypothetical protein